MGCFHGRAIGDCAVCAIEDLPVGEGTGFVAAADIARSIQERLERAEVKAIEETAKRLAGEVVTAALIRAIGEQLQQVRATERAAIVAWLRASGPMLNVDGASVHQDIAARIEHHFRIAELGAQSSPITHALRRDAYPSDGPAPPSRCICGDTGCERYGEKAKEVP